MAAALVQEHWLIQLERQLSYCGGVACQVLVTSVPWADAADTVRWLEDSMFAPTFLGEDEWQGKGDVFLKSLVDRPKGSSAAKLASMMKQKVVEDSGKSEEVNKAVYAVCAALIKHTGLVNAALTAADGESAALPAQLVAIWKTAQQIRLWPELSETAEATDEDAMGTPNSKVDPTSTPTQTGKGDKSLRIGSQHGKDEIQSRRSTYSVVIPEAVKQFAADIVDRCVLLLRLDVLTAEICEEDAIILSNAMSSSSAVDSPMSSPPQSRKAIKDSSKIKNARGSAATAQDLQELLNYARRAVSAKAPAGGHAFDNKLEASSPRPSSKGSVIEKILRFAKSSVTSDHLEELRELRNSRAGYRIQGFELATLLLSTTTPFSLCSALSSFVLSLKAVAASAGTDRTSYLIGVEGCSKKILDEVRNRFGVLFNAIVKCLQTSTDRALSEEDIEDWNTTVVQCICACTLDFEQEDFTFIQRSGLLAQMQKLLRSQSVEVQRRAWSLMETLLTRCLRGDMQEKIQVETFNEEDEAGPLRLRLELVSLLLDELKRTSEAVYAQRLPQTAAEAGLLPAGRTVLSNIVSVSKDGLGYAAPHNDFGLNHSFSLWIRRPRGAYEDLIASKSLREGCTVTRGPDWPAECNDDGGEDKTGTVLSVEEDTVTVRWEKKNQKSYRFGAVEDDEAKYDVELLDSSFAGVVYQKGAYNALEEDERNQVWSCFGLQLRGDASLRMFAVSGQDSLFTCQTAYRLPPDVWTHVAVVQNKEKCRIYVQGALEVEKTMSGEQATHFQSYMMYLLTSLFPSSSAAQMLYPGKGGKATHVLESPHPYLDNTDQYTVVETPGALSFTISFDPRSKTEANYGILLEWNVFCLIDVHIIFLSLDFVSFYKDDTHTEKWGDDKYTGGRNGTTANWPGVGGRPPLKIPASRFVFYFKSDGSNNGIELIIVYLYFPVTTVCEFRLGILGELCC